MCKHGDPTPQGDFGKEAPFQRSDKDDLSNPYGQHMGPSQLDRIEQMLLEMKYPLRRVGFDLGAPAPASGPVGRSTPAAGCAEPTATTSRNPSADSHGFSEGNIVKFRSGYGGVGQMVEVNGVEGNNISFRNMDGSVYGWAKSHSLVKCSLTEAAQWVDRSKVSSAPDPGFAKEYRDGGGKELDIYLFKKGLDELGDRLMELWTKPKPKFTSGPPIPEGSISYKMRFVDEDGEPIKGEPRVFLDPEQSTR